ncbi:MAG: M20 family metallopeptidase [Desulfarculaceae bacterium]|nr:M20 family metallopeptidase [Desulfarculaceae bacterium]MCF8072635.1 M20 family metallopeptidase [Desulfarculaceae bacterium]MCF8102514.1 M20 family metallopeptidase [Desulfarculaceae bacterium]MCF8117983.1 M20 family metallopeptidase [Desulfarculaceae bacterium]
MLPDPVELTSRLVRLNTCNPPGNEAAAVELLSPLLSAAGYELTIAEFAPGRPSLVATLRFGPEPPLMMTGHLDTVSPGDQPWQSDPFDGAINNGLIHGRGSSDMKSGVAIIVWAALALAAQRPAKAGLVLALTAGEETSCQGAEHLAQHPELLGGAKAVLVAEPTGNRLMLGHKGALWLKAVFRGVSAHGSMPELGDNAIHKAAAAVGELAAFSFDAPPHPVLGPATLNVGTISGGKATNVVPDRAELSLDLRLVPGMDLAGARARIAGLLGPEAELTPIAESEALWTDPGDPWVETVAGIIGQRRGQPPQPAGATYFTDGAALSRALGDAPTLLLGPGSPDQAHVTDETCRVANIPEAAEDYLAIAQHWCA